MRNAYLTLGDISILSGVSPLTVSKYKAAGYLDKFMSGEGRTARFSEGAIREAERLRNKGLAKRGRPRKQS